ncbi:MDR family MFS transporter [Roseisolibacter sp. H3M3-2]|uniref:MDR family MFS transporter n=1 Tax=Roseisolibacter sp. H3M3-2 TaxID=3031323 RepID=UPI0023D9BEBD|nr:MDR family MFS transporter [Roseisolibacter sp. H3M3-2]MDF1505996.1 MDR family MFS transporter [Roseisolibacter sp. H3M3-2]
MTVAVQPPAAVPAPATLTRSEKVATLTGVLLGLLLAGLDQTIVSTAGPAIQRDLRIPPSLYPWITTAYLVASTVMVPVYGKLSDTRGRKPVLLAAVALFLVGSVLCGLSPTTGALVAARAVQGLGAAGLFTTAFAVIADLFPPRERGRYTGLVGAIMGLSSVVGPLVGGFLTDRFGWHWVFFVNLPIGAVALWFIVTRMPRLGGAARGARPPLDLPGVLWLVLAVVPLLVALSLGRSGPEAAASGFGWGSPAILGMLATAAVAGALFFRRERVAPDPILDLRLFRNRTVAYGIAATFVLGAGFLSAVVFLPLFMVNVVGVSATRAGLTMTPLTLGMVTGSVLSGRLVARTGCYKPLMLGGLAILAVGFTLMAFTLSPTSSQLELTLKMVVVGLGIGPTLPLYTLAVQNAAPGREVGVVTAASTFTRSLGQVMGVALVGSVFAATLAGALARETGRVLAGVSPGARELLAQPTLTAVSAGAEETAGVSFDPARVRQQLSRAMAAGGDVLGATQGTPAPQPGAAPRPTTTPPTAAPGAIDERDRAEALGAVDRLSDAFKRAFTSAIGRLYMVGLVFVAAATLLTLRIPQLPLRRDHDGAPPPDLAH